MKKLKIGLVSLGCDKNRIDSEIILSNIMQDYEIVKNPEDAEIIIVNTCGFIEKSKQESINTILEMAQYKKHYNCEMLVVTGCLSQRYKEELLDLMDEIDILLGVNDYHKLNKAIEEFLTTRNKIAYCSEVNNAVNQGKRLLTTEAATAYLRIGEGCDNFCTYCVIPYIRGRYRSRAIEEVVKEASELVNNGVKELILVAQDTTRYGIDLYKKKELASLLRELSKIEALKWIRILYCYPEELNEEIIDEIASNSKVCKYIDIPIQHISNNILKRMNRRGTKEQIVENIKLLREKVHNITLRTTLIVGFPGESEEDFKELVEFVEETRFDKLGVFTYSQEEGTKAAEMSDQIDEDVKLQREEEIMLLQQGISSDINSSKVGRIYDVLIEGNEDGLWYGRSYEMSPDIDGVVWINSSNTLVIGEFTRVKIVDYTEYDLIGVVEYESCQ